MESMTHAERRKEELKLADDANREKVEAMSSPETPTPTQEEADAIKAGTVAGVGAETAAARQEREREQARQRDLRPGAATSGYQTR